VGNQNDESEHGDDPKEYRTPCASDKTMETIDGVLEPLTIGRAHTASSQAGGPPTVRPVRRR
jgi:hypothetical protein